MSTDDWGRSDEVRPHFAETGTPYVPVDYAGPIAPCNLCGNNAPDVIRTDGPDKGKFVCQPCYEGGIELHGP